MEDILLRLEKSAFRSRFHLKSKDKEYIKEKGMLTIQNHAHDLITKRLAPQLIANDGKQTPMRGHPVFIAQHATATCCRKCLSKWHHIAENCQLNEQQINYIVCLIMQWIKKEMKDERC